MFDRSNHILMNEISQVAQAHYFRLSTTLNETCIEKEVWQWLFPECKVIVSQKMFSHLIFSIVIACE